MAPPRAEDESAPGESTPRADSSAEPTRESRAEPPPRSASEPASEPASGSPAKAHVEPASGTLTAAAPGIGARLFLALQRALPRHALTALIHRLSRIRRPWLKNLLIRGFARRYDVALEEAASAVPEDYADFNAFFTRALRAGARPLAAEETVLVSPCDGAVSECGRLEGNRLLQAKGIDYTLEELLAGDGGLASALAGGSYATLYLAPPDYHRVHMPLAGELADARHLPGDLYSVNAATAALLPRLFARNERLVCRFEHAAGTFAVVMVGALNVGSISTVWGGELRAGHGAVRNAMPPPERTPLRLERGETLGWFNLGSTVILLFAPGMAELDDRLAAGRRLRMGEAIGRLGRRDEP